ncbi:MAG: cbb3-type cytochrome c oxidase subunit 3 [Chromatiales bacterium]|jgi:cytochrome c oxidase cbb3-type subunit 4
MDINDFRAWHTLVLFLAFIGIIVWAYSRGRKKSFDEAAHLPFEDDQTHNATMKKENKS